MAVERSRRKPLPQERRLQPGDIEGEATYTEQYGLRTLSLDLSASGMAKAAAEPPEALRTAKRLTGVAAALLREAGEKTALEIIQQTKPKPEKRGEIGAALFRWTHKIELKYGSLSPISVAAQFLGSMFYVTTLLGPKEGARESDLDHVTRSMSRDFISVICLCEAWHWLHMDVFGGHRLAMTGHKVGAGRMDPGGHQNPLRDMDMAREFQRLRKESKVSDSRLKEQIGRKYSLRRRAAIYAINRGLQKIVQ
jgi:hypothetical protein